MHGSVLSETGFSIESHTVLGQLCLRARFACEAGVVLARYTASRRVAAPARYTVQCGLDEHLQLDPEYLQYINHSCDPNVFFDVDQLRLVTLRPIEAGEELAFFYPSTEWSMAEPFDCACGSDVCLGNIAGASLLPPAVLACYRLSSYIQRVAGLSLASNTDNALQSSLSSDG
jgi:hypothetical protein